MSLLVILAILGACSIVWSIGTRVREWLELRERNRRIEASPSYQEGIRKQRERLGIKP